MREGVGGLLVGDSGGVFVSLFGVVGWWIDVMYGEKASEIMRKWV